VIRKTYNPPMSKPSSPIARPRSGAPARRSGRPPRSAGADAPALGRERIVQAALALIDERGLAAFSIRELAGSLGVAPAAIYWHVPNRDALLSGAIALALDGVAAEIAPGNWQERLRALIRLFRDALRKHPHLAPAIASEMAYNAAFDAPLLEHIVAALEEAQFEGRALVDAFNVVVAAMCGFATLELSSVPPGPPADWEAACRAQIDAVDARVHPRLAQHRKRLANRAFLLRWSSGQERPLDEGFEAWVDVVVRGLAARSRALRREAAAG
jgi:AcrR family transcriptional regulator